MKNLSRRGAAAVLPLLLLLGGCSAGGTAASLPEPADGRAADYAPGAPAQPESKPGEVPTVAEQLVARTASVGITVPDVEDAAVRLRQLAASMGGVVTGENLVSRVDAEGLSKPTSTMVVSVPADKLDATLEQLKAIGTITSRVISSDDVTTQVADVESRIQTLNGSIDRLNQLAKRTGSVTELTRLENEITNRISERDSLVAQQKALAGRVATSPITISLETPAKAGPLEATGFLGGLAAGWNALVSSSRVLLTIVGAVLPFLVVIAAIGVPLLMWRRRATRKPAAATAEAKRESAEE